MGCKEKIKKLFDGLNDREISAIIDDLEMKQKMLNMKTEKGESVPELMREGAIARMAEIKVLRAQQKRAALLKIIRAKDLRNNIELHPDSLKGIRGQLVFVPKNKNVSAEGIGRAIEHRTVNDFLKDLVDQDHKGIDKLFKDKNFNEAVAIERGEIRDGGKPGITGNGDAEHFAKMSHKYDELLRKEANEAGANIAEMPGYNAQSHNATKIMKAGYDQWLADEWPLWDKERMFGDLLADKEALGKYTTDVYANIVTGIHGAISSREKGITTDPGSLASLMSRHREIIYNNAKDFLIHNEKYGNQTVVAGIFSNWTRRSRDIGLMKIMGPNPDQMLEKMMAEYARKTRKGETKSLLTATKQEALRRDLISVSGRLNVPANPTAARIGSVVRAFLTMGYLGQVTLSSLNDIVTSVSNANYHGIGFLDAYGSVFKRMVHGRPKGQDRTVSDALLGRTMDRMIGSVFERFSAGEGVYGVTASTMNTFVKWSGIDWWTTLMKEGHAMMLSEHLAHNMNNDFNAMDVAIKRGLLHHGITEEKWNIIRQTKTMLSDGIEYITPEGIRDLPDEVFGENLTKQKLKQTKQGLEDSLRSYFIEEVDVGVISPGAREKAMFIQGKPGSVWGEATRSFMQFKMFPLSMANKVFPRLKEQGMPGAIHFILMMTAMGYASNQLKDLSKGRGLRDPRKQQTWIDAMLAGGAASIYTDFIFKDYNKYGGSFLETVAGPTAGSIADIAKIFGYAKTAAMEANEGLAMTAAAKSARFLTNRLPFANLFYTKAAIDYLLLNYVNEALNPGVSERTKQKMEETYGQDYTFGGKSIQGE